MEQKVRVLMITSEYPTPDRPSAVPFIVRQETFLRRNGIDVDVFAFKGGKKAFNYVQAWRDLRRHTRGKTYDLVHAQWGHSAALALPKRLPWVITFRGNDLEGIVGADGRYTIKGKILQLVAKTMARLADERIVVSKKLASQLGDLGCHVIPSGLDLDLFRPLPKLESKKHLNLPHDRKLVLFVLSTIDNPRKRLDLAQAAVNLLKERMDVDLVIASKVSHNDVPRYMSACDVLLLTSMHEGSPNVVKEALACNLPVVSVDVGDVRQRISDVGGSIVCDRDDPESIATALENVLTSAASTNSRGAVANLDERITTRRVIEVYERALSGRRELQTGLSLGGERR